MMYKQNSYKVSNQLTVLNHQLQVYFVWILYSQYYFVLLILVHLVVKSYEKFNSNLNLSVPFARCYLQFTFFVSSIILTCLHKNLCFCQSFFWQVFEQCCNQTFFCLHIHPNFSSQTRFFKFSTCSSIVLFVGSSLLSLCNG